jgi:tRNA A37 threonylcarbamoyladenosine biosynthesis protein TsaE
MILTFGLVMNYQQGYSLYHLQLYNFLSETRSRISFSSLYGMEGFLFHLCNET